MYITFLFRYFPKVFGEKENESLQTSAAIAGFQALTEEVGQHKNWVSLCVYTSSLFLSSLPSRM